MYSGNITITQIISMLSNTNIIKDYIDLISHKTYRLENFEDNFEKKDGLARGLIAFVSCVCV